MNDDESIGTGDTVILPPKVPVVPENFDFDTLWNPKIYIDNVVGEPKRTSNIHVEYENETEAYCVERRRVKGTFLETMELWEFPFDVQLLITCLSFVTFAVNPAKTENRLQITFTLVLTAVAFKFVVNQNLPKISYLTYLDRYILSSMITLTLTCFWHGIQSLLPKKTARGESVDHIALVLITGCYFLYNLQFFIRLYAIPFKKRRMMEKSEKIYEKQVRDEAAEKLKKKKKKFKKRNILARHKKNNKASAIQEQGVQNNNARPTPTPAHTPLPTPVMRKKEDDSIDQDTKEPELTSVTTE